MALAQQYPNAYDGILSAAPAINWSPFVMSTIWPAFYMNHTGQYPQACELDYITSLAIEACDELDGVKDGLIAEPEQCLRHFNATEHVGKKFVCSTKSAEVQLTAGAADVATAIWTGPTSLNGEFMWYGFDIGSSLSTIAPTSCTDTGDCFASGQLSIATWWRNFVDMDPESNRTSISWEEFDILFKHLKRAFDSTFETSERDLSSFRDAGGKLINFHGLVWSCLPALFNLHPANMLDRLIRAFQCGTRFPTIVKLPVILVVLTISINTIVFLGWHIVQGALAASRLHCLTSFASGLKMALHRATRL